MIDAACFVMYSHVLNMRVTAAQLFEFTMSFLKILVIISNKSSDKYLVSTFKLINQLKQLFMSNTQLCVKLTHIDRKHIFDSNR